MSLLFNFSIMGPIFWEKYYYSFDSERPVALKIFFVVVDHNEVNTVYEYIKTLYISYK